MASVRFQDRSVASFRFQDSSVASVGCQDSSVLSFRFQGRSVASVGCQGRSVVRFLGFDLMVSGPSRPSSKLSLRVRRVASSLGLHACMNHGMRLHRKEGPR